MKETVASDCHLNQLEAINDVKQKSSAKSKVGDIIYFTTGATFINSEVKKVTKR